ncbi:MAG: hypothetical protein ACT4PP_03805 [Sporichthyaceae bacterium]
MAVDPQPPLPERNADESDAGWGEVREDGEAREDWLREQRPPHHGG